MKPAFDMESARARYYFEFDYDREKLSFLGNAFRRAVAAVERDLDVFTSFLSEMEKSR